MKFKSVTALLASGLMLSTFTWLVAAPATNSTTSAQPSSGTMMATMAQSGMHHGKGMMQSQTMPNHSAAGMPMGQCAMSAQTCRAGGMMMHSAISPEDPSVLLALKSQLKLTADQEAKLEAIAQTAQTSAKAVLTPDQLAQLKDMPANCGAMAATCGSMAAQCTTGSAAACNLSQRKAKGACPYVQSMMAPAKSDATAPQSNSGT